MLEDWVANTIACFTNINTSLVLRYVCHRIRGANQQLLPRVQETILLGPTYLNSRNKYQDRDRHCPLSFSYNFMWVLTFNNSGFLLSFVTQMV